MSITRVQGAQAHSASGSFSTTVAFSNGVQLGNLLVAAVATGANGVSMTPPDPAWTKVADNSPAGASATIEAAIWYLVVDAAHANQAAWTWTIVGTVHTQYVCMSEWNATYGWPINPLDQTALGDTIATPVAATVIDSGTTPTTIYPDELWIGALAYKGSSQAETLVTSGWTSDLEATLGGNNTLTMLYRVPGTTGTADVNYTIGVAAFWAGCVATFRTAEPASRLPGPAWHRPRWTNRTFGRLFTPFQAIPAWVDRNLSSDFIRATSPVNIPRYVRRGLTNLLLNYSLNISTRFRLMSANVLKDISTRFILISTGGTNLKDIATRLRLGLLKDIQTRLRLGLVRDITTRLRLRSADQLKDVVTRFRLRSANQLKDVATRFRLAQQSVRDVTTRFRLKSADQLKDIATRFRLMQLSVRDIQTRFRLRSANQLKDIATRLRLGSVRDVATRFRLGSLRDIATRFRLMSASQLRDIAARLRLGLLKDISTRFILSGNQAAKDIATRFRLRSANILKDITTRFRLGIVRDVQTRFRLAQQRINDVATRLRLRSADQLKDISSRFRLMSAGQLRDVASRFRLRSASVLKDIVARYKLGMCRDVRCRFVLGSAAGNAVFQFQSVAVPMLNTRSTVASRLSAAGSRLQSLTLIGGLVSKLTTVPVVKSALNFTHIGAMMPAPNTTVQSTITVTDVTGTLVSNASIVSLTVTFPDQTTTVLTLAGGGISNLGSGQYQAKYNTKSSGPTRELWSVTASDGTTTATYQTELGVGY